MVYITENVLKSNNCPLEFQKLKFALRQSMYIVSDADPNKVIFRTVDKWTMRIMAFLKTLDQVDDLDKDDFRNTGFFQFE